MSQRFILIKLKLKNKAFIHLRIFGRISFVYFGKSQKILCRRLQHALLSNLEWNTNSFATDLYILIEISCSPVIKFHFHLGIQYGDRLIHLVINIEKLWTSDKINKKLSEIKYIIEIFNMCSNLKFKSAKKKIFTKSQHRRLIEILRKFSINSKCDY